MQQAVLNGHCIYTFISIPLICYIIYPHIITTLDDNSMGMYNNIKIDGMWVHINTLREEIE